MLLFGDRLKALREEKELANGIKITQKDVGDFIGVSDRVYGYYESNERFPKDELILGRIADYFNVTTDYLLGRTGEKVFPKNNVVIIADENRLPKNNDIEKKIREELKEKIIKALEL